ncbi:hypothetical protein HPP92_018137 [Vanilla planifolia]|uniref:ROTUNDIFOLIA like 8 n=1 Tax=Vanilla planifolia TaxID=51239 RepID=A0A835QF11_VANPL|nr:hypothetical protein HPP92_018137 [Vanilla planifolia]
MELQVEEHSMLEKNGGMKTSIAADSTNGEGRPSSAAVCSFARRCASLAKEQRARFYIMRRCVAMLICWREMA